MSLDKQRILNELGSVMNQLQSADCGCMGKLFNGGQGGGCRGPMGNPLPTCGGCRRGSCPGHGCGVHYANMTGSGDPSSMIVGGMSGGGVGMHGGMHRVMDGGLDGEMGSGMGGGMHLNGIQDRMPMPRGMIGGMGGGMRGGIGGEMGGGMEGKMGGGMGGRLGGGLVDGGIGVGMGGGLEGGMGGGMKSSGMPFGGMGHSMGRNAPRLYADTYNYLNKNMMQPVMQEVYNDLKSITPQNTIASNPLAQQMGLSVPGGKPINQGNAGGMDGQMPAGGMNGPGTPGNPISSLNTPQLGGMGANIVNMMMNGGGRPKNMPQGGGQLTDPMLIDAPHSPHGQVGLTPLGNMSATNTGGTPGQPYMGTMGGINAMGQGNPAAMMQKPTTQFVTQDNAMLHGNAMPRGDTMAQGNVVAQQVHGNTMPQGMTETTKMPGMMNNFQGGRNPYGHHSAGIKKFNEMFPGVMQGDLNFDPMAIAVQMNPANQKQAAIDTMTKLMNGNRGQANLQPTLAGADVEAQQFLALGGQVPTQQHPVPGQQQLAPGHQQEMPQQQVTNPGTAIQPNQQQVYATHTGVPVMNQQIPQQPNQGQENDQNQVQLEIDPNTGAFVTPRYDGITPVQNANQGNSAPVQGQIQEPIHPVDTSKNTTAFNTNQYQYNTLGQPVHYVPGKAYYAPTPGLPQTLGGNGHYVKNTMSKTSLAGTIPVGTSASRSQLQHIYRQYKASHSLQNLRPLPPIQAGSASAGNLNIAPGSGAALTMQQIPVEKEGGDTTTNNQVNQQANMNPGKGQVGDSPVTQLNTSQGDTAPEQKSGGGMMHGKGRNGLQDIAYTPYRGGTAWSFHG